jgi:hypothetical protein
MKLKNRSATTLFALTGMATLAVVAGSIDRVQAATISTLFSTGSTGIGIIADDVTDTHYTVTNPSNVTSQATATRNRAWAINTTTSAWIGPVNGAATGAPGSYVYTTTFDLTGFDPNSANITGTWWADNTGTKIRLNSTDLALTTPGFSQASASRFNITSGFIAGANTLSFFVTNTTNAPSPTGLQVELSGNADLASTAVPEPSELLGTTLAFGSIVLLRRKMVEKAK